MKFGERIFRQATLAVQVVKVSGAHMCQETSLVQACQRIMCQSWFIAKQLQCFIHILPSQFASPNTLRTTIVWQTSCSAYPSTCVHHHMLAFRHHSTSVLIFSLRTSSGS